MLGLVKDYHQIFYKTYTIKKSNVCILQYVQVYIEVHNGTLLSYYTASSGNSYRCFGKPYQSHLQAFLKIGPTGCPETSERITTTRCVITEKSAVLIYFRL
jgi:hypothetical protein